MRSVRSRLAVVLIPALLLPVLLAVLAIGVLGPRQQRAAAQRLSEQAAAAIAFDLAEQCQSLGETARYLAQRLTAGDRPGRAAANAIDRQRRAFAVVVDPSGKTWTSGTLPPGDPSRLTSLQCSVQNGTRDARGAVTGPPVVAQSVQATDAQGKPIGTVAVGRRLDGTAFRERLLQLKLTEGQVVALACPGGAGVSTANEPVASELRTAAATGSPSSIGRLEVAADRERLSVACGVAVGTPRTALAGTLGSVYGRGPALPVALILLVVLIGGLLVLRLASSLTEPILALTRAAERVTRGDYTRRLPTGGRDELGRLSGAFNHMTEELQTKIGELERSRDLLRENVTRLGDALQRTHDLDGLLTTVLQAAASATEAQRATAWLVEGESVVARVSTPAGGPRTRVRRLPVGVDIAGEVAQDGRTRRLGHGHEDGTTALGGPTLAAPLRRANGVLGVVVVEREPAGPAFTSDDEAMLTSLAGPAGIAVDNVLLHREAQRLSVTDPLTGAGNLRHMTTTLAREVERSTRFDRPLSVLLLDLDHFKNVNDTYGHTVGDAVLRELARRLAGVVREVDTVARYGGEEFVVVTPETDTQGAQRLAQRICETVREEPFRIGSDVVEVTVSVGVASLPIHGTASSELVRAADEGLYAAKHAGRDQWQVAPGGASRVGL
ncbi:MAG TPA: diguanylate cyclase [Actinomycetales bacterium]|nr:diguanylate cyclase [Actinomycetales bacterium]